jgi:hypothetical protein
MAESDDILNTEIIKRGSLMPDIDEVIGEAPPAPKLESISPEVYFKNAKIDEDNYIKNYFKKRTKEEIAELFPKANFDNERRLSLVNFGLNLMKPTEGGKIIPAVAFAGEKLTEDLGDIAKAKREQDNFNKALEEGDEQLLKSQFNQLFIERQKLLKRLATAQENNNKRAIASLERQLRTNQDMLDPIKQKLDEERETTAEIDRQNQKKKEQEELIKKNEEAAKKLKETMTAIGEEIESSIKNNLREAITGAKTFGEAMTNVLNRLRDKIIDAQLDRLIGGFGDAFGAAASGGEKKGLGGFLGGILGGLFKDKGGPVRANQPYIVGERQPEIFVPKASGTVIPSVPMGGQSVVNNISISVDATGTAVEGNDAEASQFGEQLAAAIQAEIINQKRSGGLLN